MKNALKKAIGLGLAFALIAGSFIGFNGELASKVYADETKKPAELNLVSVQGKGIINAEPNIAYVNLAVKTLDKDIKKAQSENAKAMANVIKELKALGIEQKHIQTEDYTIRERYDWSKDEEVFKGYEIQNSINVKVTDITKAGTVLDKGISAGANIAGGISFDIENREQLYNEALKLAMKSANAKANAILGTFGAKADKPYRIVEAQMFRDMDQIMYNAKGVNDSEAKEGGTGIQGGSLSIIAIVDVDYKY